MNFKLSPDVFFRKYGNNTIVYQTKKSKLHLMTLQCFDVLSYFRLKEHNKSLYEYVSSNNNVVLNDTFKAELDEFINQLLSIEVLIRDKSTTTYASNLEGEILENGIIPEGTLYNCMFELTYRCNERCKHCYCVSDDSEGELSTIEIKSLLDQLKEMNTFEITFTGGDIFVREDAFEIIEYAYSLGFLINIFTNGIALKDEDFLRLRECHLKSISFSIYDAIPEKHDDFTSVKGSFNRTLLAAKKCRALGMTVKIKSNITHDNKDRLLDLIKLVNSIDANLELTLSITPKNNGDMDPTELRLEGIDEYKDVLKVINMNMESIQPIAIENLLKLQPNRRLCWAGVHGISINPFGKLFACNALLIECGDVRKDSIKNIWEKSDQLEKIRSYRVSDLAECGECKYKEQCAFCMGNAFNETGNPLKKYSEACNITKAQHELGKEKANV